MRTYTGIWLDRRKAFVATFRIPQTFDDTGLKTTIVEISSNVEKRVRPAGGSRTSKTPWGPQQVVSESRSEARHQSQLRNFYRRLLPHLAKAHRILIMGPGEAKTGLMKVIADNPALAARVAGVGTRDKMTPKQVASRVGAFFQL